MTPVSVGNRRGILDDLVGVVCLALVSLMAGVAINQSRATPMPLGYLSPEQRLTAELTTLVEAPPFRLSDIDSIAVEQVREAVDRKNTLILDARAAPFYEQGHIPGALNLSRDNFAKDYRQLKEPLSEFKDKPIIVYCSGGDCHDSRMVASALLSLGFPQVRVFTEGWSGWTQAGLPVAR